MYRNIHFAPYASILLVLAFFLGESWIFNPGLASGPEMPSTLASIDEISAPTSCSPTDVLNLVAYWPLDEEAGATTFDEVVNKQDGICSGDSCPSKDNGLINGAFKFDGADQITVLDTPLFNWTNTDSFSFEMWVKMNGSCSPRQVFLGKYSDTYAVNWNAWWVGCAVNPENNENTAAFNLRDSKGNTQTIFGTKTITDGLWHHLLAVRDSTVGKNQLYVDGQMEVEKVMSGYTGDFTSGGNVNMGYFPAIDFHYPYTGLLDEVAVYHKVLTPADAAWRYNEGKGQSNCNRPPEVTNPGSHASLEGQSETLQIVASDPDTGTTLTFAAKNLPDGFSIDSATGLISGMLSYDASVGSPYQVEVQVSDSSAPPGSSIIQFTWEVANVNRKPLVQTPPDQSSQIGKEVSLQISSNDPDGDAITFGATNLPPDLQISSSTGLIIGTISQSAAGNYLVEVVVQDSAGASEKIQFNWTIGKIHQYLPLVLRLDNR